MVCRNWETGFRRNTDDAVSMNGFVVGGSLAFCLRIVKGKDSQGTGYPASAYAKKVTKTEGQELPRCLFSMGMQQLKDAMNAYDVPLMYRSLDLLKQALTEGQISLIEYFVETESIYKNLQRIYQIENQYKKGDGEYLQRITYKMLGLNYKSSHLIIIRMKK